jgi:UTP--glucose-1-phosphate uridylyltransferase
MQTIRKAVVPAAGLGTRLHTLARGQPKEMLSIGGRPMIYYTVHEAAVSGLEHLYVVINKRKRSLRRYLESDKLETDLQKEQSEKSVSIPRITFIDQPVPLGSGDAIYRTKEMIGQEPFALMMPDFLFFGSTLALAQMIPSYERFRKDMVGVLLLGSGEAEGFGNVGIFQPIPLKEDMVEVRGISQKLKTPLTLEDGKKMYKAIGRCILGSHFFSYLETVRPLEGEWDDAHALRALCKGKKVMGKILEGTGFDVGNPVGYRAAEKFAREFAPQKSPARAS